VEWQGVEETSPEDERAHEHEKTKREEEGGRDDGLPPQLRFS
jgi:hypothetical protein